MTDRQKCKVILALMAEKGHEDVAPPSSVDSWTDDEVDYFLANYEEHYFPKT
jgi:hypothetical protein